MPETAIDAAALHEYVKRVAALMIKQKQLAENIAEVCSEADDARVCTKRELRGLAKESLIDPDLLQAQLLRMQELRAALGDFTSTPLGDAALKQGQVVDWPTSFAQQPVHQTRRGRPRKVIFDQDHPKGAA